MDAHGQRNDAEYDDGSTSTPLHLLRPFGRGLHRQPVTFVKAGAASSETAGSGSGHASAEPAADVSELYLSIVMGEQRRWEIVDYGGAHANQSAAGSTTSTSSSAPTPPAPSTLCEVCQLPVKAAPLPSAGASSSSLLIPGHHRHETCLVHQVSLEHSRPPSSIDRRRRGLQIMEAQGWDPDSGRGLGAEQQGMPRPIRVKARPTGLGLGTAGADKAGGRQAATARTATHGALSGTTSGTASGMRRQKTHNAKQIRKMADEERRRTARLREQILGNRDLDKYLRG